MSENESVDMVIPLMVITIVVPLIIAIISVISVTIGASVICEHGEEEGE